jgi:transcriptional regulator with XRE-family HTH domain
MSVSTIPRRAGVRLDPVKLDQELARRGVTARQVAAACGLHETVISRARHGRALSERNLQRLAKALLEIPLMGGADLLLVEPEKKIAGGSAAPAISKEVPDGSSIRTSRK